MEGEKVKVYYNLHKKCLSVQTKTTKGWRVTEYTDNICLKDVEFKVSESGRKRVLKQKKKNVHAFVIGTVCHESELINYPQTKVVYDPYVGPNFCIKGTNELIFKCREVQINGKEIYV